MDYETTVLPVHSMRTLRGCLSDPAWCNNTTDAYRAGALLEQETMENLEYPPGIEAMPSAEQKAIIEREVVLSLTKNDIEICRKCMKHAIENHKLPISKYTKKLQTAFGLTPDN